MLRARVRMLQGTKLTFDEESQALYDAVAPSHPDEYFDAALQEIDRAIPGPGALVDRYDAFRRQFIIPSDRLSRVFERAIAEYSPQPNRCRTSKETAGEEGRASPSSTSRRNRGAATTGIRAAIAA